MPRLEEFRGFSGFDAPAQNPFIRFAGGRALESDVNDARMSLDFGGVSGGTRGAPTMAVTEGVRQPSRGLTGDNSNAGLVNRTLFDNQANTDWWSTERGETVTASAGGTRQVDPGVSGGVNGAAIFGEPTVQTPTSTTRDTFDLDNAPSLFPDQNEWWRDGALAQGASTSNEGGGIWEGNEQIGDFLGDLTLGTDPFTSLADLQFGEGYPEIETPEAPLNALVEGTGIPVEPDVLDQEYEWTTSSEDRRFLAGTPEEETPQNEAGTISVGGTSISGFGGNMSLGAFLNFPSLTDMRYGEGYPRSDEVYGVVTAGGQVDITTGNQIAEGGAEGHWVDVPGGQEWRENAAPRTTTDGTGTTTVQIPTQSGGNSLPSNLRIIGHDTITGAPIYQDSQGNRFVAPGSGTPISAGVRDAMGRGDYANAYGTSAMSAAAARNMAMANWGMGIQGSPLRFAAGDAGRDWFGSPSEGTGYVSEETGTVLRKPNSPGSLIPTRGSRRSTAGNSSRGIGGLG